MRTGLESHTGVAASPDAAQHAKAIGHLLARIDQTSDQIGDLFPLSADPQTGTWMTAPDGRWTGGFWCGQLWLALQASGDAKYRVLAENALQRLQGRLKSDNVLNGLVFYYAAALGKQLHQSHAGAALGALGAEALARCFNPGAGFIPLGHDSGSLSAHAETKLDMTGRFEFECAPAGECSLRRANKSAVARSVVIKAGETARVDGL